MNSVCERICHEPQTGVILKRDRHREGQSTAAASWHGETDGQAGRLKQTGKQTDKQGQGNAPESDDTSQCLLSATEAWAEEGRQAGGMRGGFPEDWHTAPR